MSTKNPYAGTKTEQNLREAFAGESQIYILRISCKESRL